MCAKVCPTEVLCEQVCVRNTQEGKPVQIGRLQRHAVDAVMFDPAAAPLFTRAAPSGKTIAVLGAGPGRPGLRPHAGAPGTCGNDARRATPRTAFSLKMLVAFLQDCQEAPLSARWPGCCPSGVSRCATTGSSRPAPNRLSCALSSTPCSSAWAWFPPPCSGAGRRRAGACKMRWTLLPRCVRPPTCPHYRLADVSL